ncbi:MAG: hypothetical protein J5I98_25620 [Phaeodactylibacter sp.]|nr:hypothetical protein [Phaeodactylibacter sp.]
MTIVFWEYADNLTIKLDYFSEQNKNLLMHTFRDVFGPAKPVIGMIHVQALPGTPAYGGSVVDGGCGTVVRSCFNLAFRCEKPN